MSSKNNQPGREKSPHRALPRNRGSGTPRLTDAPGGFTFVWKTKTASIFCAGKILACFLPPQTPYLLQKLGAGVLGSNGFYLPAESRGPELHPAREKGTGTNGTPVSQPTRTHTHPRAVAEGARRETLERGEMKEKAPNCRARRGRGLRGSHSSKRAKSPRLSKKITGFYLNNCPRTYPRQMGITWPILVGRSPPLPLPQKK